MSETLFLNIEDKHSPQRNSSQVGQIGEELAARFLRKNGYRLVAANFKTPIGRNRLDAQITGEIDLIALDADVLCFVEVKTRSSDDFASPLAAVDLRKQRQIIRTARMYRKIFQLHHVKIRYDVISVILPKNERPTVELFKNYFNEEKFRKNFWADRL
ncbi:MAG TPA: YraN family protein [Pyrinomonadaceae bacterium]|nr:YraN family protein [Pyrinomonadaceae bacterium]